MPNFGYKHREETKRKISLSLVGNQWNVGKKASAETRKKQSLAHAGEKHPNWGKKHSEETRRRIAVARLGQKASEETKRKLSIAHANPSEETRRKLSEALRGEKGPGWKGGVNPVHDTIRKSVEYKLWRESVFKRDKYTCVWCNVKSGEGKKVVLNADHIKPFALYPELRFAIDNGRTLCVPCHKKTDTYGNRKKKNEQL